MFFSRFAAVLALASFTFALPRPHDACPGIVAHDGDGPCFTISRRQMDHGSMPGMDMPAPSPTPAADAHGGMAGMEGMHMKRHGPDGDDEIPAAVVPTPAATPAVVVVPAATPAAMAPMAGMPMKRHDACPGIVNHDGDGAC